MTCIYKCVCLCVYVLIFCILSFRSVVSNSSWLQGLYSPWNSLGRNTGVGSPSLLKGTFPIPGSNACLLHWQMDSLPFEPLGKPYTSTSSVQLLSRVWLFATPWTSARQASLSITNFQSLPKLMSIESVMPSNHLILCRPLLLLPSIFPNIRVFSNESALRVRWPKYKKPTLLL